MIALGDNLTVEIVPATTYIVGDSSGWDISTNLDAWVADKKFKIGDSLSFQYSSSSYNVDEVTRENYDTCNTTNILKSYANGNTTVTLTRGGDWYFVCGNQLYCLGGMKLHALVEGGKTFSPAPAPKAVFGSNQKTNAVPVPQSSSSKKSTHFSNGAINYARNALYLIYIALLANVFFGY
ncbi:unnamed protein product [Lupinus luteus]|uniref:Phytocyanin domain-containing protein n=1 Tax=Lupinus luteus TaxID=3873 RepID=A0AAV1XHJ8_LUPLU